MADFEIRNFTHHDVEDFIRLATSAFADEWLADGMTPEGFARQTRQIFRWNMIPFRFLTALVGIQWEAFVVEVNGRIVAGGMYNGRKNRMSITNLMVEPEYRRQGIGQALLIKRLERLSQRKVPFVTATVLETNQASLGNLRKQGFVEYERKGVYRCNLPLPEEKGKCDLVVRKPRASDRARFMEIEKQILSPFVLHNAGTERVYFPSLLRRVYGHFLGSRDWIRVFETKDGIVGFLDAYSQDSATTGYISQPVIAPENAHYFPEMIRQAGAWLKTLGLASAKIEVSEQFKEVTAYLQNSGWTKEYTWIHLVKWLDDQARQQFGFEEG